MSTERQEEAPTERRQKNPNKVAAGKKSAENRRKKQEEAEARYEEAEARHADVASRLARLEENKLAMHRELVDEETIQPKEPEQPITVVTKDPPASGWPIETIVVGGLGLAVIAYMVYRAGTPRAGTPRAGTPKSQAGAARPKVARSVPHTEVHQPPTEVHQRDPFYME